jgi:predicted nucleotidyltransferase
MRNIAFDKLKERNKELNCIYNVEELLKNYDIDNKNLFKKLINIIPNGWQYPAICQVRIIYENKIFESDDFIETQWSQHADIIIDNNILGKIQVFYTQFIRLLNNSQFLPEEQKLLNTIVNRLGNYFFHKKIKHTLSYIKSPSKSSDDVILSPKSDEHWKWRLKMANIIAKKIDFDRFGVGNFYIIGSTKNANAGPNSDIDLLIHFTGNENQKKELTAWIEGWSLCLSEMNYFKTGYKSDGLIDLHIITDHDIKNKTSFAVMINSAFNSARLLKTTKK